MATESDRRARLLQLYDELPADAQWLAIEALQRLQDRDPRTGPFGWLIGYHYTHREPGLVECSLDVTTGHLNPGKIAHGGIVYSIADAAMGASIMSILEPGQRCVTAELKVNYLQAVESGRITAFPRIVRKGNRLVTALAEVKDDEGELIALAVGTFVILQRRSSAAPGK